MTRTPPGSAAELTPTSGPFLVWVPPLGPPSSPAPPSELLASSSLPSDAFLQVLMTGYDPWLQLPNPPAFFFYNSSQFI